MIDSCADIPVKCWTRSETDFCKQHTTPERHYQHTRHRQL